LTAYGELGLDNAALTVLLNLLAMWHEDDEPVWLAVQQIANNMGVSTRTVERSVAVLIDKKLIALEKTPGGKVVVLSGTRRVLEGGKD
jgi:predicted transcriptional regulator